MISFYCYTYNGWLFSNVELILWWDRTRAPSYWQNTSQIWWFKIKRHLISCIYTYLPTSLCLSSALYEYLFLKNSLCLALLDTSLNDFQKFVSDFEHNFVYFCGFSFCTLSTSLRFPTSNIEHYKTDIIRYYKMMNSTCSLFGMKEILEMACDSLSSI